MAPVSLLITLMSLVVLINAEAHLHTSIQAIKTAFHIDRQIADGLTQVEPSGFEEEIMINSGIVSDRDTLCNPVSLHPTPSVYDEKISTKTLYCTYLRLPKEPDVTIQRYRIEIQSEKPVIVTIHNVITVKEADHMVKQAENKLCQSPTEEKQPVDKRIGQAVWFTDHHDKIFATISERVNHITGLSTKGSEIRDFQVVNYGIGDALNKEEELEQIWGNTETPENDIATFILYLQYE